MPTTAFFSDFITVTRFLLILLTLCSTKTESAAPILGLDSFLAEQYRIDPRASKDSYPSLSSSLKKALSSPPTSVSSLTQSLLSSNIPVSIYIKLVGSFPTSSPSILHSYLSATLTSNFFYTISPFDHQDHHLLLQHNLHVDVSHNPLGSRLSEAINSEISGTPSSFRSRLHSIPYESIDGIIRQNFEKEKPNEGIYIYLLNLGTQSKPYAYSYTQRDSSPGYSKCLGTIWAGKERYLWVDLGAGPVDYGPALSGDGVLPKGEFHPFTALHGRPKSEKAFLADMASIVYSAYQVLLVPPLRIPVPFETSLIVNFIHIYGSESKDPHGLDWKVVEDIFMDGGLLIGEQSLSFNTYSLDFRECPVCSFAISRSMNSYTSRFLFDNYTLIVNEYLDSKRLHQILSDSTAEFRRLARVPDDGAARVLPVYVFDLDYTSLLLLDRYHQSVSFKDMVIAVRTRNSQTVSEYNCNGRHVFMQTRELERPLVGSVLQSMWGVSPTHLLWSAAHNSTLVDYTWSVGHTPFGPFSEVSSFSFVQRDAARRNALLTSLNYSIESALEIVGSIDAHGGGKSLVKLARHGEFVERWNLFKYKVDKAIYALSHLDFGMALFFLRSSDHDLYALHSAVYGAFQKLEVSLVCFKDPPFPWASVSLWTVGLVILYYAWSRREKIFINKRKQF